MNTIKKSLEERISRLEALVGAMTTIGEKNSSNIEYIAMMNEIDIWEDEEDTHE